MIDTEAAWLAGFIDGEGSIMVICSRRKGPKCPHPFYDGVVAACNTDKRLISRCIEIAGGFSVTLKKNAENPKWKNAYHWRVKGSNVVTVLNRIMPFLVSKRRQAELVLRLKATMKVGSKPGRYGSTLTDCERKEKEAIWMEVKALNHRGVRPKASQASLGI